MMVDGETMTAGRSSSRLATLGGIGGVIVATLLKGPPVYDILRARMNRAATG